VLNNLLKLDFLQGYRTIAAAIVALASAVVLGADGDVSGALQSVALGLGLLGIRFGTY